MSLAADRRVAAVDRLRRLVSGSAEPGKLAAWVDYLDTEAARIQGRWVDNDTVREDESNELLAAVAGWIEADQAAILRPGETALELAERQATAEERLRAVYARIAADQPVDNSAA